MENRQPQLRFPEFSTTLDNFKLDDVVTFKSGGTPSKENESYWNGDIPWISATSMQGKYYSKSDRTLTEEGLKKGSKLALKGSLLLLVRGSMLFNKIPIGITQRDVAFNQDLKSLIVNDKSNTEYLYQWFSSQENLILDKVVGTGIGAGKLDTEDMKNLKLNLPSLPEQTKIATFLTAVDEKLTALKQKKTLLEQYKKGVMQQIFSQELRFKDDNGNDFSDWEKKKLGEISRITTGSSNRIDSNLDGEFTFFDRSQDIRSSNRFLFDTEAIIVPGEGQEFIPKYFIGKFDLHQRTYAVMNFKNQNGKFLFYSISYNSNHLNSHAVGSTVKSLRLPMFEKMPVNLPILEEQIKIANFLSAIDEKINQCQGQIEKTQVWKKGLLQQLFV
ncbi:restriction endonuclease subunit S [Flavobacterium weaverense]|uniref:Restriction endonuclease S subunit n=1 Tax=Flavobacterium weaverense TaxID=271156 RepID=A0A3L9ZLB6_9FLAO|nr:restriction endonuclease subunit S [Flavobacterium weaverense]RMA73084.1 restriction endonuclease S subunit [Flavobacterium weaverense]